MGAGSTVRKLDLLHLSPSGAGRPRFTEGGGQVRSGRAPGWRSRTRPRSGGSVLGSKENWTVGAEPVLWTSRRLPQCRGTKASGFWLVFLPHSSPRLLQPPSLERKAIWRLSKRMAFTFRERAGEDCFQVAPPGPRPAWLGQRVGLEAWAVGPEEWLPLAPALSGLPAS